MEIFRWSFSLKIYSSVTFKLRTSGEKLCIFGKWFSLCIFFCGSDIRNERMTLNKKIRLINILVSLWYYLNNVHHVQCLTYLQWWMIYSNKPWILFCKQSWRFSGKFFINTQQVPAGYPFYFSFSCLWTLVLIGYPPTIYVQLKVNIYKIIFKIYGDICYC